MSDPQSTPSAWTDSIPYRVFRAHQNLSRHLAAAVQDLGVTITQLGIAVHLDEIGDLSASDLARLFSITPQSSTTALNRLEELGWVQRLPHPVHRRIVWYELTDLGREKVVLGRDRVGAMSRELDELLTEAQQAELRTALATLTTAYRDE